MKKILSSIMGIGLIGAVSAASLTNTLTINGWVQAACQSQLQNPQAITFTFVGSATPEAANNSLVVNCTKDTNYNVVLYSGNGATKPTIDTFALLNSSLTNPSQYAIAYTVDGPDDTENSGNWSAVAQGSPIIESAGSGAPQSYAFSIVPESAATSFPAGNYTDTLTFNTIY